MDPLISKYIIFLWQKDLTFRVSAETNLLLTWGWLIVIGCIHSRHVCASMMETCSRLMSRFINSFSGYLWSAPVVCLLLPGLIFGFSLPPCGFGGIWSASFHFHHGKQLCCSNLMLKRRVFFFFVCFSVYIYVNNTWVTCICLMTLEMKSNKMNLFLLSSLRRGAKNRSSARRNCLIN